MLSWIVFGIPWQIQVTALVVVAGLLIFLATMIFGIGPVARVLKVIGLPLLGILGAIGLLSRAQQKGYGERKAEEDQAAKHAEVVVDQTRTDVQGLPDDKLDERTDRWTR
jgi:hypothetical protein